MRFLWREKEGLLCTISVLLFIAMKTYPFWLGELIVPEEKTETGWSLSGTKEHSDKLELALNGLRSVRQIVLASKAEKLNAHQPKLVHNSTAEYLEGANMFLVGPHCCPHYFNKCSD